MMQRKEGIIFLAMMVNGITVKAFIITVFED